MVNIAVLDDEAIYIDHIKEITDTCMQQMNLEYRIRVYDEGQDVLDDLENNIYYDIYLLDVRLPDINGLEVAKMLREGKTYLEIAEKTGASTATISRVNRSLNYGTDGYDMVFERLFPDKMEKREKKDGGESSI